MNNFKIKLLLIMLIPVLATAEIDNFKKIKEVKERTLIQLIKEKNGLVLSEEEKIEIKYKNKLKEVLEFYEENKLVKNINPIKEYVEKSNLDDLLNNSYVFQLDGNEADIKKIVYSISLLTQEDDLFDFYVNKIGYQAIDFNLESLPYKVARDRISKLYNNISKRDLVIEDGSYLLNLEAMYNYKSLNYLEKYVRYKDVNFKNDDYIYLVNNEQNFKDNSELFRILKEKLLKKIEENKEVVFKENMINEYPNYEIKKYNMRAYNKNELTISVPFVAYLLKTKTKLKYTDNYVDELSRVYGFNKEDIKILKVEKKVLTYVSNRSYREYDLDKFIEKYELDN